MNLQDKPVSTRRISLPRHLFLLCATGGLLTPLIARLPGVAFRGWDWFSYYFSGMEGFLLSSAFNLVPALVLYGIGKASRRAHWVWQEEMKKTRSILAARKTGGGREVILVGARTA